jgi:hypothetical protein
MCSNCSLALWADSSRFLNFLCFLRRNLDDRSFLSKNLVEEEQNASHFRVRSPPLSPKRRTDRAQMASCVCARALAWNPVRCVPGEEQPTRIHHPLIFFSVLTLHTLLSFFPFLHRAPAGERASERRVSRLGSRRFVMRGSVSQVACNSVEGGEDRVPEPGTRRRRRQTSPHLSSAKYRVATSPNSLPSLHNPPRILSSRYPPPPPHDPRYSGATATSSRRDFLTAQVIAAATATQAMVPADAWAALEGSVLTKVGGLYTLNQVDPQRLKAPGDPTP